MHYTIFDTPFLSKFLHYFARFYMRIKGWRNDGKLPDFPKCVMIAAPHTSNWDLFYTLIIAFSFPLKVYWMGKDSIFKPPFKRFCKWLGGIPIDRSKSNNMVDQSIEVFKTAEKMVMIVPPEGTRKKVRYWKTGFYYIAYGAGVPIILGFVDYKRKVGGLGPVFTPTGNIESDMREIQSFYSGITGKRPDLTSNESIRAKSEQ
jgi:1-acyl-sn-glycerol-3-phosphate acyltransferase